MASLMMEYEKAEKELDRMSKTGNMNCERTHALFIDRLTAAFDKVDELRRKLKAYGQLQTA